jgi:2-polyprenyl-6-methoxyphenol hydroxylase-like FAD-dependent oxidoreductase
MPALRIVIIGGGIGGLALALALRREGFEPEVYERAPAQHADGERLAARPISLRLCDRVGLGHARHAR